MLDYYGTVARIGLINMAGSTVMEPEFYAMAPSGVSIHTSRMHLPNPRLDGLAAAMDSLELERCTSELAASPLHAIVFGGTSATFLNGLGWDEKIAGRMRTVSRGIPVTTTSTACVRALRTLKAKRMSFMTPYDDAVTEAGRFFFTQCGFEVVASSGLKISTEHAMAEVSTRSVCDFVAENADPGGDVVLISCTNFRSIGAIATLEETLGIPVISAVQASFWDCLNLAGVKEQVRGFGSLFSHRQSA